MANDGTGADWDTAAPANTDLRSNGALEIRDLRLGTAIRVDKEHIDLAGTSAGGQHVAGSAVAYVQSAAPTTQPDGTSLASTADDGRLWIDTDDDRLYYWTGSAFKLIVPDTVVPYVKGTVSTGALSGTFGSYVIVGKFFFSLQLFLRTDSTDSAIFTWVDNISPSDEETRISGIRVDGAINTVESLEIDVEQPSASGSQFRIRVGSGGAGFFINKTFSYVALVDNSV